MDLHVQFLLNSGCAYLPDPDVSKRYLCLSGVARASWDSVLEHAGIPKCPPFPNQQLNSISDTWEYKWKFFKRSGCQPYLKKCGFQYRTEHLQLGLCFWLHHCSFLGMTPPLPWLCCLIHKMKVTIFILLVQCPNWQRSCGTAELSWLKWVSYFAEAYSFSKAWANWSSS